MEMGGDNHVAYEGNKQAEYDIVHRHLLALGALSVLAWRRGGRAYAEGASGAGGRNGRSLQLAPAESQASTGQTDTTQPSYIKWVEFNAPYTALSDTLALDIKTHEEGKGPHVSWIDSLAWLACKNGATGRVINPPSCKSSRMRWQMEKP